MKNVKTVLSKGVETDIMRFGFSEWREGKHEQSNYIYKGKDPVQGDPLSSVFRDHILCDRRTQRAVGPQ